MNSPESPTVSGNIESCIPFIQPATIEHIIAHLIPLSLEEAIPIEITCSHSTPRPRLVRGLSTPDLSWALPADRGLVIADIILEICVRVERPDAPVGVRSSGFVNRLRVGVIFSPVRRGAAVGFIYSRIITYLLSGLEKYFILRVNWQYI